MTRLAVALLIFAVLLPVGRAQTFIRSLPTSTNLTSATKVPVDDATYGTRAVTLENLLASTATNATLLAAITNVVEDTATALLGKKLDTTNGTAVALSGSVTNLTHRGTLTYDLSDESRLAFGNDYGIGLDVGLSSTTAKARLRSVSTLADLVAADPLASDLFSYVTVLGYTSAGDGGGGQFQRVLASSGITNRGTFFNSTANATYAWKRILAGNDVTPAMFGMIGIPGVGEDLVHLADSAMSVETYNGANHWRKNDGNPLPMSGASNDYLIADMSTVPGKMYVKLKASSAVQQIPLGLMSGAGVTRTGRYLVSVKARLTAGTGVAFNIQKTSTIKTADFTPTGTETTFTGYFDNTTSTTAVYIRLANSATSNGSEYTFDDFHVYYVGPSSTLTEIPVVEDAPDENTAFADMLNNIPAGSKITLGQGRFYYVAGGDYYIPSGCTFDFNGSTLFIDATAGDNGLVITDDTTVKGPGKLKMRWDGSTAFGTDRAAIMAGYSVSEISPTANVAIHNLELDVDGENYYGILALGVRGLLIHDINFADSQTMRKGIVAAWNGDRNPQVTGVNPIANTVIYNVHAGVMGQNYPSAGGGCVVGATVGTGSSTEIFNIFADSTGRSGVNVGPGDYSDTELAEPYTDSQMSQANIYGCSFLNSSIGIRVTGVGTGGVGGFTATDILPMQVNVHDNFLRSVGGGPASVPGGGIQLDSSIKHVTVQDNVVIGHKYGVLAKSDGSVEGFFTNATFHNIIIEGNRIFDSELSGIELSGLVRGRVAGNFIQNSGTLLTSGERAAIRLSALNDGVELDGNVMGYVGETATNQIVGIAVVSTNTNVRISARNNRVYGSAGTAAGGTPYSWGASASYGPIHGNTTDSGSSFDVVGAMSATTIDLGNSDTTLARSAAGRVSVEGVELARAPTEETLTYSSTTVTVTAGKGPLQLSQLTCTNAFTLAFTSLAAGDAGTIYVAPSATNCTVTLSSYCFGPSGTTLTITGGTGNTNYTELAWKNNIVGGTNRVSVNALNYYR